MPALLTTAPPTAVPNEMPTLNAMGSTELASTIDLGWRLRATSIKCVMHDTENRYMSIARLKTKTSASGMAAPAANSPNNAAACSANVTSSAFMPKRASIHPPRMFEIRQNTP